MSPRPKIAFLFLMRAAHNHPAIWEEYLDGSRKEAAILSHTKEDAALTGVFSGTHIDERLETAWGRFSLVEATLAMLRRAYALRSIEKFVLVSESCVPIVPFEEFRGRILAHPKGYLLASHAYSVAKRSKQKARRMKMADGVAYRDWYYHSQWVILNREAAEIALRPELVEPFRNMRYADESYFASAVSMAGRKITDLFAPRPPTFTNWENGGAHPLAYAEVTSPDVEAFRKSRGFFARKFPRGSNIGAWRLHLHGGAPTQPQR